MKRTSEWWARLSEDERAELVFLEHHAWAGGHDARLPDDCHECPSCMTPATGTSGLCAQCALTLDGLIRKADGCG